MLPTLEVPISFHNNTETMHTWKVSEKTGHR